VGINWVNHASFVLEEGDVRLISDPWLEGKAFADSWSLLSESRFTAKDFASITHIWLSHEHPDHFSPSTLKGIPEEFRRRITVMTQPTRDRKVFDFCRGLGFARVLELPLGEWFDLAANLSVMCQSSTLDDSWLAIRTAEMTLLNLNDCMIGSEVDIRKVTDQVGYPIDILLSQFSFASWIGNRDDVQTHIEAARASRERLLEQVRVINPRYVVPFASFVWFSHEENAFMNNAVNRIEDIVQDLQRKTPAKPVVMYPGDSWQPGVGAEPTAQAIARYTEDYESIANRPYEQPRERAIQELIDLGLRFRRSLLACHGWLLKAARLAGRLPPTPVWLTDHQQAVKLSLDGISLSPLSREECDVAMSSDALAYVLGNLWGGMTLVISGRFEVPSGGDLMVGGPPKRFGRYVTLADDANHGYSLAKELKARIASRLPMAGARTWLSRHKAPDQLAADSSLETN